ncbi:protein MGARP isoform X2 [Xenopus laevis]|uniref:Protein MGARP isoform X2 n=1 Tax=Xenopus laevis TaxID=8355 RepID=A0A8J1MVN4_XENLA|nr:protein MGARP isoform X2 [Xenopus laevis]
MYLGRTAWQKLAPVARSSGTAALLRNAPARQMSSSSVPGSSGSSLPYTLFVCASFAGGGVYVYNTITRDRNRFQDRHEYIQSRPKPETAAKPWPPQGSGEAESSDVSEAIEEAAVTVEAVVVAVEEIDGQETIASAPLMEDTLPEELPIAAELEAAPLQGEEADISNISKDNEEAAVSTQTVTAAAEDNQGPDAILTTPLQHALLEETEVLIATESVAEVETVSVQVSKDNEEAAVPTQTVTAAAEDNQGPDDILTTTLEHTLLEETEVQISTESVAEVETVSVQGEEVESTDASQAAEEVPVQIEVVAEVTQVIEDQATTLSAPSMKNETLEIPVSTESMDIVSVQGEEAESSNVATEEVIVAVTVEAVAAEESEKQDTTPAAPLVTEETLEDVAVSEEPVAELDAAPLSAQNTGTIAAASAEELSPVLEETSVNIPEELAAAAADDWSELSAHKPEDAVEEAVQGTTVIPEVAQPEVSTSS